MGFVVEGEQRALGAPLQEFEGGLLRQGRRSGRRRCGRAAVWGPASADVQPPVWGPCVRGRKGQRIRSRNDQIISRSDPPSIESPGGRGSILSAAEKCGRIDLERSREVRKGPAV